MEIAAHCELAFLLMLVWAAAAAAVLAAVWNGQSCSKHWLYKPLLHFFLLDFSLHAHTKSYYCHIKMSIFTINMCCGIQFCTIATVQVFWNIKPVIPHSASQTKLFAASLFGLSQTKWVQFDSWTLTECSRVKQTNIWSKTFTEDSLNDSFA